MKKIFASLLTATVLAFGALGFAACDLFGSGGNKVKVSTLQELLSVAPRADVVLTQDIDCDFTSLNGIECKTFDGQGHTIKNAVLSNAFFITNKTQMNWVESVKNVTFDNMVCRTGSTYAAIVASCEYGISMENVTVKNSTLEVYESSSNIYAGIFVGGFTKKLDYEQVPKASFKNCVADNVSVKVGSESANTDKVSPYVFYGGLIGYSKPLTVEGCSVTNSDIYISLCCSGAIYAGGLVGYREHNTETSEYLKNSFVEDTDITVNASYTRSVLGVTSKTCDAYIGGLAGYYATSGSVNKLYSSNNKIETLCSGRARLGGLFGEYKGSSVTASYSSCNYLRANYCDNGDKAHMVGGLIGAASNCAITSCFTVDNTIRANATEFIHVTEYGTPDNMQKRITDTTYSLIGGLIGYVNTVSMTFCAAGNTVVDSIHYEDGGICDPAIEIYGFGIDDKADFFALGGTIMNCYITGPTWTYWVTNSQNLEVLDENVWHTNEIKTKLNLVGSDWVISDDNPPALVLSN